MIATLGALNDFTDGTATRVEVGDRVLTVVRLGDEVYVLSDRCSHEDFSLSGGDIDRDDKTIECSRHGAIFSLATGDALSLPASQPVPSYIVKHVDGALQVELP
jgi:3-phenylpropionate/trans-cinnamate dioxygenase ferredoxin subunit